MLINNATYQREETLLEQPIRQPLKVASNMADQMRLNKKKPYP